MIKLDDKERVTTRTVCAVPFRFASELHAVPITPLHLGPGLVAKAAIPSHFSLTVFTLAQVTMDLEVVARVALGARPLHGFTNTLLGGTVVLVLTVLLGKRVSEGFLHWWNSRLSLGKATWLSADPVIPWRSAWVGGLFGVYSHWFLDAVMHSDVQAFSPFSSSTPFHGLMTIDALNIVCLATFPLGLIAVGVRRFMQNRGAHLG